MKPAVAALIAVALADVIFAVDSVPAILAITTDTFVVFAANAFALLGLRALFFLVAGAVARFAYLQTGLGVLLLAIAGKLVYGEATGEKVPTSLTLAVIAVLTVSIGASLPRSGAPDLTTDHREQVNSHVQHGPLPPHDRPAGLRPLGAVEGQVDVQEVQPGPPRNGMTGAEAAAAVLRASGLPDLQIRPVAGRLSDHYDPRSRTLNLSADVGQASSLAALGVAAHEAGHAIQDSAGTRR